jgi:hypothetical protein
MQILVPRVINTIWEQSGGFPSNGTIKRPETQTYRT